MSSGFSSCLSGWRCGLRSLSRLASASLSTASLLYGEPTPALAQNDCGNLDNWLAETDPIARKYAPMYWFGPGELYFPTLPFHTAFDGIDNRGLGTPGLIDFADPGEIAPLDAEARPSWNLIHDDYVGADQAHPIFYSAVIYRVQPLDTKEIDHFWRFIISDEQAWRRLQAFLPGNSLLVALRSDTTQFLSIEYHAYYLRDLGLVGHNWDTEYSQMIVPAHSELADRFHVQIGPGHTERISNNVLVISGELAQRELVVPPSIIVELGDHSTAPDVQPYGDFRPGLDVNWHTYKLWGIRDAQAFSGRGALGQYQTWMSFPRNPDHSVILFPGTAHRDTIRSTLTDVTRSELPNKLFDDHVSTYALVPGDAFICLSSAVRQSPADLAEVEHWMAVIQRAIGATKPEWGFTGFAGLTPSQKQDAIAAMNRWFEGQYVTSNGDTHTVKPSEVLIWQSKHYRSPPSAAYKQHLYRPTIESLQRFSHWIDLIKASVTWHTGDGIMAQAAIEIPAFWLPTRLPGFLEFHVGAYAGCTDLTTSCGRRWSPALSLMHTGDYYALASWYVRASWVPRIDAVQGDTPTMRSSETDRTEWLISGGLSLALPPFRLRLGLVTDLRKTGIQPGVTTWEFILSNL